MNLKEFEEFLLFMFEEIEDEKLYESWKSDIYQDKPYKQWKEETLEKIRLQNRSSEEVEKEAIESSQKVYDFLDRKGKGV